MQTLPPLAFFGAAATGTPSHGVPCSSMCFSFRWTFIRCSSASSPLQTRACTNHQSLISLKLVRVNEFKVAAPLAYHCLRKAHLYALRCLQVRIFPLLGNAVLAFRQAGKDVNGVESGLSGNRYAETRLFFHREGNTPIRQFINHLGSCM